MRPVLTSSYYKRLELAETSTSEDASSSSPSLTCWPGLRRTCREARHTCTVHPSGNFTDDSPAIVDAFSLCGQGGTIVFLNETYWIEKVMNTTGLNDVRIDLSGTLLWSAANISYWLENSLPLGFQNQSSAWFLGGNNIVFDGHGHGTLDGNGQIWYDFTKGVSNLAGRPHALTIWETNNSTFTGIRFVQSQMWCVSPHGAATCPQHRRRGYAHSDHINFRRWEVHNGDDSIAMKRNSSDILIEDSVFYTGLGVAIGSIGQYPGEFEFVERVLVRNCSFIGTRMVGYIKTWTGVQQGFPPNGGGGGTGTFTNSTLSGITQSPAEITQCTTFSGAVGGCDTSTLQISNITWSGLEGSMPQCSAAAPCQDLRILDSNFVIGTNASAGTYSCHAIASTEGFSCPK
ncbi:glycoside hydrolase family 28 protein [Mycena vulgaris]|nr:glycoside hydrolase family 28 protein [Mycena vulgaris]